IRDETVFCVIHPDAGGNVHGGNEYESFADPAFLEDFLHVGSYIDIFAVLRGLKSQIFRVRFHSAIIQLSHMHGGPGRILILDDEPSLLRMLNLYLVRLGYETECYGTIE